MVNLSHNNAYTIKSPLELVRIIEQVELSPDHYLFYLGFSNPNDIDNCGNQKAVDVARNPLVALFFACVDNSPNPGEIIIYHIPKSKIEHCNEHCENNILELTDRGTFIFIEGQQHNADLLATDKDHHKPLEIIVDQHAKPSILKELEKLGVSLTTLYPEMF